jgi:hypothetical protein
MKLSRIILSVALLAGLVGLAHVAQKTESAGMKMAAAGEKFVSTLGKEQKAKAVFEFDSKERTNWHFIPMQDGKKRPTRKGLPLQEMSEEQRKAALALLEAGTSESGNKKALTIMSLEAILRDLEKGGSMVRNPEWYFFTIFGTPSKSSKWGWRVEGHHLSLNFVVDKGKVTAATPNFFGANPAVVKTGKRKGLRTLKGAEDLAIDLFKSFDDDQKKTAYQEKEFPEIKQGDADPGVGQPRGLPAGKMTEKQRGTLVKLLESYTNRLPADVGDEEMKQVKDAGLAKIHFAYAGGLEPGKPHTYRVQGPTFVVEFLNVQPDSAGNRANHIHSCWRHLKDDFGVQSR